MFSFEEIILFAKDRPLITSVVFLLFSLFIYVLFLLGAFSKRVIKFQRLKRRFGHRTFRKTDLQDLSWTQARKRKKALKLIKQNHVLAGAKILFEMGLERESISVLEKNKYVKEAASILLMRKNIKRAASIYARNAFWKEAYQLFLEGNLVKEAAQCARQLGDYQKSYELFIEAQEYSQAADVARLQHKLPLAIQTHLLGKHFDKALNLVNHTLANSVQDLGEQQTSFENSVQELFIEGHFSPLTVQFLKLKGQLVPLIFKVFYDESAKTKFRSVIAFADEELTQLILRDLNYSEKYAHNIAEAFENCGKRKYAAIIYEQLGNFQKASTLFETLAMWDRAITCYQRLGQHEKANRLIEIYFEKSNEKTSKKKPVTLQDIEEENHTQILSKSSEHHTQVLTSSISLTRGMGVLKLVKEEDLAKQELKENFPLLNAEYRSIFFDAAFISDLSTSQKEKLWKIGQIKEYASKEVIVDLNTAAKGVFCVLSGQVEVIKPDEQGGGAISDILKAGETFGELWLLMESASQVCFKARNEATLVHLIKRSDFNELMHKNASIAKLIYKRFTQKLLQKLINPQNQYENYKKSAS